jgi:hypothetical protein
MIAPRRKNAGSGVHVFVEGMVVFLRKSSVVLCSACVGAVLLRAPGGDVAWG